MATPLHHRIIANGLEHHLLEWAPADDASPTGTALLIHGFMDAAGTWDLVAPALSAAGLRVLAPDMRGFGEGPRAPAGAYYHFADYVADVDAIVRGAVGDEPLFVVGHSMGGTIAALFSGARPERVTKLALLEGIGPPDSPHDAAPDRMAHWLDDLARPVPAADKSVASREDALRRLTLNHPRVPLAVLRTRLDHLVKDLGDGRVAWRFDPLHKTHAPIPFFAKSFEAFARRVACPVLFVGGGSDGFHPPDEEARVACFRDVTRRELPDAGHMMHWTRPAELSAMLVGFWRG